MIHLFYFPKLFCNIASRGDIYPSFWQNLASKEKEGKKMKEFHLANKAKPKSENFAHSCFWYKGHIKLHRFKRGGHIFDNLLLPGMPF